MSGPERARNAWRDIGVGIGTVAVAVALTFWGTLATLQAAFVLLTFGVLIWFASAGVDRLRGRSGWPRPMIFGAVTAAVTANAAAFSFTGLPALLLSCLVLLVALVVGLARVIRRLDPGSRPP